MDSTVVNGQSKMMIKPTGMAAVWPVIACGVGLFSDGYLNGVIGSVNTLLALIYPNEYAGSTYSKRISSIVFVGTVVGQLLFGYFSDKIGRKFGILSATIIVIVFSALSAGSYGAGGSVRGMFAALTVYRFFLGIGIGAEYPAGSVAASEATNDCKKGWRHALFIAVTNCVIDAGFVVAAFVPLVLVWIFGENHIRAIWRIALGLGVVPPLAIFWVRLKLKEPERFQTQSMRNVRIPYLLVLRRYWFRLIAISIVWFLYDFTAYSFGIFSSPILERIIPNPTLVETFGWNTVINLFYIPGAFAGAFASDWLGPKTCLVVGVTLQAIIGFFMSGFYSKLVENVAGFAVIYGIFLTFGEFGPGDNIGLIASKSFPTAVRGQCYGIAAAIGKIGAFAGSYAFTDIINAFGGSSTDRGNSGPFFVGSAFAVVIALITLLCLPKLSQECIEEEDIAFRAYLVDHGWDVSKMGLLKESSIATEAGEHMSTSAEMTGSADEKKRQMQPVYTAERAL
ncbi:glycerophosphoinositol permease [Saitoella coloradoensis]